MEKTKIGSILRKGGTIEEIRKENPNIPENVTVETFMALGYAESTAKNYIQLLKRNSKIKVGVKQMPIIKSEHANFSNIIIDTCALGRSTGCEIVDNASACTVIQSTLQEMDRKKNDNKSSIALAKNLRSFLKRLVEDNSDKYLLSSFEGSYKYNDDNIIEYLRLLPRQIRPTLLTADVNLVAKAKTHSFDYILITEKEQQTESVIIEMVQDEKGEETDEAGADYVADVEDSAKIKEQIAFPNKVPLGRGVYLSSNNQRLEIMSRSTQKLYIVRGKMRIAVKRERWTEVEPGDYLQMEIKNKGSIMLWEYKF